MTGVGLLCCCRLFCAGHRWFWHRWNPDDLAGIRRIRRGTRPSLDKDPGRSRSVRRPLYWTAIEHTECNTMRIISKRPLVVWCGSPRIVRCRRIVIVGPGRNSRGTRARNSRCRWCWSANFRMPSKPHSYSDRFLYTTKVYILGLLSSFIHLIQEVNYNRLFPNENQYLLEGFFIFNSIF